MRKLLFHAARNPLMVLGIFVVVMWVLIAIFTPQLAPYGPLEQNIPERLQEPGPGHLMGTDQLGRDVLSRVLYGSRISLPFSLLVIIVAFVLGTIVGAIAGYIGGIWDELMMRITEVFMAFPTIILAMAVAAALGPSLINAVIAMVVVWWPNYARVVRGLVIGTKKNEYVEAARAIGASDFRILARTILPNCVAPGIVMATVDIGNAILMFAGLSFLGLGAEPSTPEWGRMVSDGIDFFDQWWMSAFPGLAIFSLVVAFNFIGDGIRDLADPRMRRQR